MHYAGRAAKEKDILALHIERHIGAELLSSNRPDKKNVTGHALSLLYRCRIVINL